MADCHSSLQKPNTLTELHY